MNRSVYWLYCVVTVTYKVFTHYNIYIPLIRKTTICFIACKHASWLPVQGILHLLYITCNQFANFLIVTSKLKILGNNVQGLMQQICRYFWRISSNCSSVGVCMYRLAIGMLPRFCSCAIKQSRSHFACKLFYIILILLQ